MEEYLAFAKSLSQEAAEIALKYFGFETESTWKSDNSPLTIADTEINELVIRRINETYPTHSIYGEEKSDRKDDSRYIWVCDPIDGTIASACGMPLFVFSIALVDQETGLPVLGLVHDPIMQTTYWAYTGSGTYRNGQKITVSAATSLYNTYLCTGGSGRSLGFSNIPLITGLGEQKCRFMKFPSFTYGAIQVASGKYSGAVLYAAAGHDVAALKIITEEAGGKVTDLNGQERRYDSDGIGCVISNGILHDEILQIVAQGKLEN